MLDGQSNHCWQLCFPLKSHAGGSDFRLYDGSDLSIDEMVKAHRGLPFGFILHRYSVLVTVESFSLLYLLFIS